MSFTPPAPVPAEGYKITARFEELLKLKPRQLQDRLTQLNPFGGYRVTNKNFEAEVFTVLRYEFGPKAVKVWQENCLSVKKMEREEK